MSVCATWNLPLKASLKPRELTPIAVGADLDIPSCKSATVVMKTSTPYAKIPQSP